MPSARQNAMPRWAKSRHMPPLRSSTSATVVVGMLGTPYSTLSWIQSQTACDPLGAARRLAEQLPGALREGCPTRTAGSPAASAGARAAAPRCGAGRPAHPGIASGSGEMRTVAWYAKEDELRASGRGAGRRCRRCPGSAPAGGSGFQCSSRIVSWMEECGSTSAMACAPLPCRSRVDSPREGSSRPPDQQKSPSPVEEAEAASPAVPPERRSRPA